MNSTATKLKIGFILIMLMALAGTFSILALFDQSLRLDESLSLYQVSRSPEAMLIAVAEDVHVPLYHIILHYWLSIWGNSIYAARSLSLIFFILSIPAIYALGKTIFGKKSGVFTATIFAVSPIMLWYGSEIRMYSLMVLVAILNQYFFIRLYKSYLKKHIPADNRATKESNQFPLWLLYFTTALTGIFTHYFFTLMLLAQGLFVILKYKIFYRRFVYSLISAGLLLGTAYMPWLYNAFIKGDIQSTAPLLQTPTSENVFHTFTNFIFGFQGTEVSAVVIAFWPLAALLAFVVLLNKNYDLNENINFLLLLLAVPLIIILLVSIFWIPVYADRYLILMIPPLYLLLTWMFTAHSNLFIKLAQVLLVVSMGAASVNQAMSADTPTKENYKDATAYLEENAKSQDIIIVSAPFTIYTVEYYYSGSAKLDTIPDWDRLNLEGIEEFSQDSLERKVAELENAGYSNVWLLTSHNHDYKEELLAYFDNNYERAYRHRFSESVQLQKYVLRYDQPDHITLIEHLSGMDADELEIATRNAEQNSENTEENQSDTPENNEEEDDDEKTIIRQLFRFRPGIIPIVSGETIKDVLDK